MNDDDETDYLVQATNFLAGFRGRELNAVAAALAILGGAARVSIEPQAGPQAGFTLDVTPALQQRARKARRELRGLWRAMQRRGRSRTAENH